MAELKVPIRVTAKGTEETKRKLGGVEGGLRSLGKSAAMAAAGFFGARMLIQGLKSAVTASAAQELAEKKLEAALGKTSKALLAHAQALQQVTMFGDETILEAQAMLAAFIKDEEQLKKATQATLDLAAAKGFDLVSAADLVGKSVGSSTNALTRYGITVTGAVGSTERLEMLTTNVATLFGGQAAAQTETMAGAIAQMKNAAGDTAEAFGDLMAPAVIEIMKSLKKFFEIAEKVFDVMRKIRGVVETSKGRLNELVGEWLGFTTQIKEATEAQIQFQTVAAFGEQIAALEAARAAQMEVVEAQKKAAEGAKSGAEWLDNLTGALNIVQLGLIGVSEDAIENKFLVSIENLKAKMLEAGFSLADFNIALEASKDGADGSADAIVKKTNALYGYQVALQGLIETEMTEEDALAQWMFQQSLVAEARDKEQARIKLLIEEMPEVAKSLGLIGKQTKKNTDMSSKWAGVVSQAASMNQGASKQNAMIAKRAAQLEAIVNTAKEVTKVLANPPMAAYVAAMGAIQVATIQAAGFAKGGDFVTQGPEMIMVGDNPGGRERVQVTPLSSPNVSGPTNSFSINVSAPLVDETVVDSIIPAIQKAQRLGTA